MSGAHLSGAQLSVGSTVEAEELSKKFMGQNLELQHEIKTFRSKLDYIITYINQKLDQQKTTTT
ncbi:unnamed protein product, partial [Rotaria sp. Silwood1]